MKFTYLWDQFEYFLKKFAYPKRNLGLAQPSLLMELCNLMWEQASTDCLPPSYSIAPPLPNDVEDHAHTPIHPSHSPNITPLIFLCRVGF